MGLNQAQHMTRKTAKFDLLKTRPAISQQVAFKIPKHFIGSIAMTTDREVKRHHRKPRSIVAPHLCRDTWFTHCRIDRSDRSKLGVWWYGKGWRSKSELQCERSKSPHASPRAYNGSGVRLQSQVRRGELKRGIWHLEVAKPGEYEIELRRWPREADLPLRNAAPAVQLTDGFLGPGKAIPIEQAELRCAGRVLKLDLKPQAKQATFRIRLNTGPMELKGLFNDADGKPILGAYYAYVAHSPPIK
jgi:hypothetical protein